MSNTGPRETQTTTDGHPAKLRTSCDTCNEAKVRCSQAKPQCARCEKKGIVCFYGLSRRSHKTAPRVGALQVSAPSASASYASPFSPLGTYGNQITSFENLGPSDDPLHYSTNISPAIMSSYSNHNEPVTGSPPFVAVFVPSDFDSYFQSGEQSGVAKTPEPLDLCYQEAIIASTIGSEAIEAQGSFPNERVKSKARVETLADSQVLGQLASTENSSCNCTFRIMGQILEATPTFQDKAASFDVLLSQLRHSTRLCEDSIECTCTSRDELSIMVVSILVGRIIQGFEATLSIGSLSSIHRNMDKSLGDLMAGSTAAPRLSPRLSWGVLQIEHDDEYDLKRHLWLMQFRKLERLLSQFSTSVGRLKNARGSSSSAHVMACECTHMWLEQKAREVKEKYLAQGTIGPTTDSDS
ncbi:hypothetical protein F5Y03DRAFT_293963 [Xylaria venustula]|nr:hypothetical protein F5Y03DRAFT_293963 [Xylaria venustula]